MTPKLKSEASKSVSEPVPELPKLRTFTVVRQDGLWHLVTVISQGDKIINREVSIGDAKQIQLMKAWLALAKEARMT